MGRPKIDDYWVHLVRGIFKMEPRRSAKSIELSFASIGPRFSPPRDDWPKQRTIRSIIDEFRRLSPAEQEQYSQLHWPEAMTAGLLPWEASAVALELLRSRKKSRPPIRLVKWFYRVTLTTPGAPYWARRLAAGVLAVTEGSGARGLDPARAVEAFLVYAPWKSKEAMEEYINALRSGDAGELRGELPVADREAMREALASLIDDPERVGSVIRVFRVSFDPEGVYLEDSSDSTNLVDGTWANLAYLSEGTDQPKGAKS